MWFILFNKDEKGVGREGSSEFPYRLMLFKLWPGYWKNWLKDESECGLGQWESIGKRELTVLKNLSVFQK